MFFLSAPVPPSASSKVRPSPPLVRPPSARALDDEERVVAVGGDQDLVLAAADSGEMKKSTIAQDKYEQK